MKRLLALYGADASITLADRSRPTLTVSEHIAGPAGGRSPVISVYSEQAIVSQDEIA
jgi:hypothetical protein